MRYDPIQTERFLTTLNALAEFANAHLHVIQHPLGDPSSDDGKLARSVVCREIWRNTDIIDAFASQNQKSCGREVLDAALGFKGVIYDSFLFAGVVDDRAIFYHETGAYAARLLWPGLGTPLPNRPARIRAALVPFEGDIAVAPPVEATSVASIEDIARCSAQAAELGDEEPITSGDTLAKRAHHFQESEREREIHELLGGSTPPPAPEGFHRGKLAGMDGQRRKRARQFHYDLNARETGVFQAAMTLRATEATVFPQTIREGLELLSDDWLMSMVDDEALPADPEDFSRTDTIAGICDQLTHDTHERDVALLWCYDEQFDLVRRLLKTNPLSLSALSPTVAQGLHPMLPYVFILQEGDSFVAWMPPEIRDLLSGVDIDEFARVRQRIREAERAADAMSSMCGIVSMDDAYQRYRETVADPLDRDAFGEALIELEDADRRDSYSLWRFAGKEYLVCCDISDASAMARVIRTSFLDQTEALPNPLSPDGETMILPLREDVDEQFYVRLDEERRRLQALRLQLLSSQDDRAAHPLSPAMLEGHFVDYLMETPALRALRAHLDERVPSGQDDYEFPDTIARAVIVAALYEGESYDTVLDIIRLFDLTGCEGGTFPHTLGRLVTNAFNALPRWVLNGWSLEENTERLTGRRRFYNADGSLCRPEPQDPCPCGSGKTYGSCCGNLPLCA